jgi:hypothetical protein
MDLKDRSYKGRKKWHNGKLQAEMGKIYNTHAEHEVHTSSKQTTFETGT